MYVLVKELPDTLQGALKKVGYACKDIQINVKEKESLFFAGGKGYRGFALIVNISTGENKLFQGSFGGSNMFNPQNAVDLNDRYYDLPKDAAIIRGYEGGRTGSVRASITLSPQNVLPCLPAKEELTEMEESVLYMMRAYTSAYRKPYLQTYAKEVDKLVSRGFLSRNKAGSLSLTLKGKNAAEHIRR